MKRALILSLLIGFSSNLLAQSEWEEQAKTYMKRVNTQGITPPQIRYNLYVDLLNSFFDENDYKGDKIISIKEIQISPANNPSNWYYYVSVKTLKCSTPFYMFYDYANLLRNGQEELFVDTYHSFSLPIEFNKYVEKLKVRRIAEQKFANEAAEIEAEAAMERKKVEEERLLAERKKALPDIIEKYSVAYQMRGLASVKTIKLTGKTHEGKKDELLDASNIYEIIEIWKQKPNKYRSTLTYSNGDKITQVFDGGKGYYSDKYGLREMTLDQLKTLSSNLEKDDFYQDHLKNLLDKDQLTFEHFITQIYNPFPIMWEKVRSFNFDIQNFNVDKNTNCTYSFCVDTSTYRISAITEYFNGKVQATKYFSKYTEINGIILPLRIETHMVNNYQIIDKGLWVEFDKVEVGVPFDENVFNVYKIVYKYNTQGDVIDSEELRSQYNTLVTSITGLTEKIQTLFQENKSAVLTNFCFNSENFELTANCFNNGNINIHLALQTLFKTQAEELNANSNIKNDKGYLDISNNMKDNKRLNSMESFVDKNKFLLEWESLLKNSVKGLEEFSDVLKTFKTILSSPDETKKYNKALKNIKTPQEIKSIIGI